MEIKPDTSARILIVDDDEIFARRLALALSTRGFQTEAATTIQTAYAALASRKFDVLITDLRIAEDSGLELIGAMQREFPQSKILVLTGYGSVQVAVSAVKLGATEFLSKPADADEILEVLGLLESKQDEGGPTFASPDMIRWNHIFSIYESTGKNVSKTARQLKMHRRTLQRLLLRGKPTT